MRRPRPDVGEALYESIVTLDFDVRHLPGSLRDWAGLITALSQATDDTVETSYLELKGPLDLGPPEGRFPLAKAILAFANRDPDAAAPFFDGRALIVLGVHKGKVTGIKRIEDHELLDALRPYLGNDDQSPRWKIERQHVDDRNDVLIIVVDAPRAGDPIFTLRKGFGEHLRGKVFTRPSTASVQADPVAIDMLSGRLLARHEDFELAVTLGPEDIRRYTWDPNVLEPFLEAERRRYLRQLPNPEPVDPGPDLGGVARAAAAAMALGTSAMAEQYRPLMEKLEKRHEEDRTEKEFRAEIAEWLDAIRNASQEVVRDVIAITQPPARFTVQNQRGRFLEDIEVEMNIEGPVIQHARPYSEGSIVERLPTRPRDWGPWTEKRFDYGSLTQISPSIYNRPAKPNATSFRNSGSVIATLSCKELRPWKSHTFTEADDHDDLVLLTQDLDLRAARITATATARGIDTNCVTEFTHPAADPVDVTAQVLEFLTRNRGGYFRANP
jgi:hypothetical protein